MRWFLLLLLAGCPAEPRPYRSPTANVSEAIKAEFEHAAERKDTACMTSLTLVELATINDVVQCQCR